MRLAERAAAVGEPGDPLLLTVRAAAHAEAGDFDAAVKFAAEAEKSLGAAAPASLAEMRKRYEAGEPWRDAESAGATIPGRAGTQAEPLVR